MRLRSHWERLKPYLRPNVLAAATIGKATSLEHIATREEHSLGMLQGARVMAVSSIASPRRFHKMLEALGAEVIVRDLGDHAEYSESLSNAIVRDAERSSVTMIVTTKKDAVKSRRYFERIAESLPVYVLVHELEFLSGEQSLFAAIDQLL
jgi:tetraacyldisaccharide-1-P 4'-kinase